MISWLRLDGGLGRAGRRTNVALLVVLVGAAATGVLAFAARNANPSQARNGGPWPVWACRRVARAVEDGDRPARSDAASREPRWLC